MASFSRWNIIAALVIIGLFIAGIILYQLPVVLYKSSQSTDERILWKTLTRQTREVKDDCSWNITVTGVGGTLTSPGYPERYPSNSDCTWILTSDEADVPIFLRIETLVLEPVADCELDYLQVYQGGTILSPTLGPFCGHVNDRLLETNSSRVLLVFHSDPVYEDKGFSIDYFTQASGDCQKIITQSSGTLRSPGFPDNYPDGADCWSIITTDADKKITLFFDILDLEYGENCTFDYVEVFDGGTQNASLLGRSCRGPTSFQSSTNSLLLHFHSDESVSKKGYRARYSSIEKNSNPIGTCLWESDKTNGSVASPNFPGNYPSFANCSIWLRASEDERIVIVFDSLQLEMVANCTYDYLMVREGSYPENRTLGKFCGRLMEPKNLTSSKNEVHILFHSDDFGEFSGFKLRYWFIKNKAELLNTKPNLMQRLDKEESTFSHVPADVTLPIGASHILQCGTNHPIAKIRWLKDGMFLAGPYPLPGLKMLSNHTLYIETMNQQLAGVYTCAVVSSEKTVTANATVIATNSSIHTFPMCNIVFRKVPKNSSFAEGEFAHLECLASGTQVRITWEKDGSPLQKMKHITVLSNGFVFFERVQLNDSGVYSCIARDEISNCEMMASATLLISEKAKIEEICGKPPKANPSTDVPQINHGKIVSGHNAKKGAYPWQVMLWEPSLKSFCGGTLLNERWIATAAHCFVIYKKLQWDKIIIKLGKHDRELEEDEEIQTGIADESSIVIHPAYNHVTFDNDLALVRMGDHVRFSDYVLPICLGDRELGESLLAADRDKPSIKMGTVIGWGKLKQFGASPRYLQEKSLPLIDQATCLASTNYTVSRNMFCAGYSQEILGDACHGDSGGPFLMSHNKRWYLLGIVSWGEGCGQANKYGFYTRVPNYLPWIKGIMKS